MNDLLAAKPLLVLAVAGIVLASAGWMLERERPGLARGFSVTGWLGLLAALLLQIGVLALDTSRSDAHMLMGARPQALVSGRETRVPMASDGHFWVKARVNGTEQEFLIDTGATYTGLGRAAAEAAGITPDPLKMPLQLNIANGVIEARIGRAEELSFGTITARDLEIAVPLTGDEKTAVIGMNLLSQLASWRVEGRTLVLVPKG